uniref:fructose-bisphosphatase n=1 Tax=Mimiviridae sp. ChoanoV1 TaxID=2596887 RepID=A0A5B8IDH6_9VIRU|nr:fructose-1-6-bisphosphatase, N-terminal domain protein [Mimiviridae sp. ChoanoV1]
MNKIIENLNNAFIEINELIKYGNQLNLGTLNSNLKNETGDFVKKLDILSHNIMVKHISKCNNIYGFISEESQNITLIKNNNSLNKINSLNEINSLEELELEKYIIAFDPLDGSSNIDSNVTTGTIFAIYKFQDDNITEIVSAGYCLYGPATILVITHSKSPVEMYQLNKDNKFDFINNLEIKNSNVYSINDAYFNLYNQDIKNLVLGFKENKYNHRYIGSMVADCHRILIQGGIFLYPRNKNKPDGKIRLLYEALPFAFIFNNIKGYAYQDLGICFQFDKKISFNDIHITVPVILSTQKL